MTDTAEGAVRIRLARSLPRLLAAPVVVGLAGAGAIAAGLLLAGGLVQLALVGLGAVVCIGAVVGGILLLSVRLEVQPAAVSLVWLRGRRRYVLVPGPVTRVQLRGDRASRLRPRLGALGWGIGSARLRDEEDIDLVRLAPTRSAILLPTEGGRVAIAPAHEDELLEALARAAQARQRHEPLAPVAEPEPEPEPAPTLEADPYAGMDVEPSSLTGIERALLEERLAREREEAERLAADARIAAAAAVAAQAPDAAAGVGETATQPTAARGGSLASRLRPRGAWVLAVAPTIAAAVAWWVGREFGALPTPGTDLARLTSLALVLAGPATSIGAVMALAWWPRMVGLVVAGGLAASVLIGRSLVG